MRKGEIWLVKLDEEKSVGHEYHNDRPAIIIMSDDLISKVNVVTIAPLSGSGKKHQDDIKIKMSKRNGLFKDSIIKVHHIMSYDKARFVHKIGTADERTIKILKIYLKKHFDI